MPQQQAVIIYNPMSGRAGSRGENARHMAGLLAARGLQAEAHATTAPDDATRLAREAVSRGVETIVSYGGDGTLNEVIQGVARSPAALAVWPGGTANVVARDLGMPFTVERLADVIAAGKSMRVALGLARRTGDAATRRRGDTEKEQEREAEDSLLIPASRYFLMMAGIGLDASIARGVNKRLKRRTGELAYWVSGIKHLFTWPADLFTITVDGQRFESAFAIIGNGKGYGGGMLLTPNARLDEPLFEVYILPVLRSNMAYLRVLSACMRGKPEASGATMIKGRRVEANSSHAPWVEADGEVIGPLPMRFEIVPDALTLIVP
ncbi:MAG TPA: diacylglycerol kinase family protein [Blastocatellia bacterium]|nr:diacylglycerol kinase family protein [Blastocatellia bacterium]